MPLTDTKLRSLKPRKSPYKVSDFEGLYILVSPSGPRLWRWAYRFGGKQNSLALGDYPSTSLREARAARDNAREQLERGINPAVQRKLEKLLTANNAANTFEAVAAEWFANNESRWVGSY